MGPAEMVNMIVVPFLCPWLCSPKTHQLSECLSAAACGQVHFLAQFLVPFPRPAHAQARWQVFKQPARCILYDSIHKSSITPMPPHHRGRAARKKKATRGTESRRPAKKTTNLLSAHAISTFEDVNSHALELAVLAAHKHSNGCKKPEVRHLCA